MYSNELYHWKYIKKVRLSNGKYRYYYNLDELKKDLESKANDIYNDPNNIYDVNGTNYHEKIKAIENSKEWKDIVDRNDPEYVRTNPDDTKEYLIDDYLAKKKHPKLDVIDDIVNGRKITVNKITVDSMKAGAKDEINKAKRRLSLLTKSLTGVFKVAQGSCNDEIREGKKQVEDGIKRAYASTVNKTQEQIYSTAHKTVFGDGENSGTISNIMRTATDPKVAKKVKRGADFVTYTLRTYE